jgi:hypothetical protein
MVVRTLLQPEKKISLSAAPPLAKSSSVQATPPKKIEPKPKKESVTKSAPTPPKRGAVPKLDKKFEPPLPKDNSLIKELSESFEAIDAKPQKAKKQEIHLPKTFSKKTPVYEEISEADPTYSEYLIAYLQAALDLPEFGEVKAKLEIDRFGKLLALEILETKSRKNAEFLKKELPLLDFPQGTESSVYTITFRNL